MEKLVWSNMLEKKQNLTVFETENVNIRAIFHKYLQVIFRTV